MRRTAAVAAAKVTAGLSRRLRLGGGTALPGLVAERIDPGLAAELPGVDLILADVPFRKALEGRYGKPAAGKVRYAEAFEVCEYGRQPDEAEIRRLFPFFPK